MSERKVVLITGAASGIGSVMAQHFQDAGDTVHVCDSDESNVAGFRESHPDIGTSLVDIADARAVDLMFDEIIERYGRLDVLVNNAGVAGPTAAAENIEPADWDSTIAVNLNGQFYCARRAIPLLKEAGGGSIVNISSNAAFFGFPLRSPYTACKWALIGFTKTLAMELGPHRVRVNALCPGSVEGERIDRVIDRDAEERGMTTEQIRTIYGRQASMRLFVRAEDVASMALFLTSDAGATISGQAIGIDGHTESLSNWLED